MNKELMNAIETLELMKRTYDIKAPNIETRTKEMMKYQAIETVLNYIENSISKEVIREKIKEMQKEYKEALEENSTKAFILKCQIEGFKEFEKELLEGK